MSCPEIKDLTFSASGKNAINAIMAKQKLGNVLAGVIATSQIIQIFSGGGTSAFGMARNIKKSDWAEWAKAMRSVPDIVRGSIMRDAAQQALYASGKEKEFWTAVHYGCQ